MTEPSSLKVGTAVTHPDHPGQVGEVVEVSTIRQEAFVRWRSTTGTWDGQHVCCHPLSQLSPEVLSDPLKEREDTIFTILQRDIEFLDRDLAAFHLAMERGEEIRGIAWRLRANANMCAHRAAIVDEIRSLRREIKGT